MMKVWSHNKIVEEHSGGKKEVGTNNQLGLPVGD